MLALVFISGLLIGMVITLCLTRFKQSNTANQLTEDEQETYNNLHPKPYDHFKNNDSDGECVEY